MKLAWSKLSLRNWIALAMLVTAIPPAAAALAGYALIHRGVIDAFQDVAVRQRDQLDVSQRLRLLLWETVSPVDRYVVDGEPTEATAYRDVRQRVEATFLLLHSHLREEEEARDLLRRAQDEWAAADAVATEVLSVRGRLGISQQAELMGRFDGHVRAAVDRLGALHENLQIAVHRDHAGADRAYERSEWIAAIAVGASLMAIVFGVLAIGRIMAVSVDRLVDGASRYAAGDRQHRMDIRIPPELQKVADKFNQMIESISSYESFLSNLADHDSLTGLLNRRAFDQAMLEVAARRGHAGEAACLLMIDIDHFKRINDSYGHEGGDVVLSGVAKVLSQSLRSADRAFRFGGEEFAVLLPGADRERAELAAERLRETIAAGAIAVDGRNVRVTVSIGGAATTDLADTRDFLKVADQALYRAKENGRNRVEWGQPSAHAKGAVAEVG